MRYLFLLSLVFLPVSVLGGDGPVDPAEREIAHLLEYIEQSGCIFIRNGSDHTAAKAREHIQKKYKSIEKKVNTTEEFILYAATRSSISGTRYRVDCGGTMLNSGEWLLAELQLFRDSSSSAPVTLPAQ